MKRLLEGGRVVDPANGIDECRDVLIDGSRIAVVEANWQGEADERIDATGLVVCPGFIDAHTHLREPGEEWKEDIESGTRAAAAGGFTAIACMANTDPINDNRSVTETIVAAGKARGAVRVHPIGAVTRGMKGETLTEMEDMLDAGCIGFSDDMRAIDSSLLMRKALEYAKIFDVPIIAHCADSELVGSGVIHEGELSTRLGLSGWPSIAEEIAVHRDLLIAEYTGGRLHVGHVSTGRAIGYLEEARQRGVRVTCEVTPHHLTLTEDALVDYDTNLKVVPPLRSEHDVQRLHRGLIDGTVDAIVSDHAPHLPDEKEVEFSHAPSGVIGLETTVSICLDRLVHGGVIPLGRLVELLTTGPAGVLGLDAGTLTVGATADLTLLDLDRPVRVDGSNGHSKSRNTPFQGWELRGAPAMTIVGGQIVHDGRAREVAR